MFYKKCVPEAQKPEASGSTEAPGWATELAGRKL